MAKVYIDRVCENSTTTGVGSFQLDGANAGYRTFSDAVNVAESFSYCIESISQEGIPLGEWEVGIGTINSNGYLTRQSVTASSNNNQKVNFSSGLKNVWGNLSAGDIESYVTINQVDDGVDFAQTIDSYIDEEIDFTAEEQETISARLSVVEQNYVSKQELEDADYMSVSFFDNIVEDTTFNETVQEYAQEKVVEAIAEVGNGIAYIDDITPRTTTVYSSQQTESIVSGAITDLQSLVSNEATVRTSADTTLGNRITAETNARTNAITALTTTVNGKQNKLTFDTTPVSGSTKPVTSGGLYTALDGKQNKISMTGSAGKYLHTQDGSALEWSCPPTTRHIFEIFCTVRKDVGSISGAYDCDGSEYSESDFDGENNPYEMLIDNKAETCTYADYDADILQYGFCRKFAINFSTKKFRVPTLNNIAQVTTSSHHQRILVESNVNETNNTWYNLYSDGWCEQGGLVSIASAGQMVSLLKEFSDVNYTIVASGGTNKFGNTACYGKTTTSFLVWTSDDDSFNAGILQWEAKGYAKNAPSMLKAEQRIMVQLATDVGEFSIETYKSQFDTYTTNKQTAFNSFIENKKTEIVQTAEAKVIAGHFIGEEITSTVPIDDACVIPLTGGTIYSDGIYSDFVDYLYGKIETNPEMFTSRDSYLSDVRNYGSCGKYAYAGKKPKYNDKIDLICINITAYAVTFRTSGLSKTFVFKFDSTGIRSLISNNVFKVNSTYIGVVRFCILSEQYEYDEETSEPIAGTLTLVPTLSIGSIGYTNTSGAIIYYSSEQSKVTSDSLDDFCYVGKYEVTVPTYNSEERYLVKSWQSELKDKWYNLYSDGWCEQGGEINSPSASNTNYSILLDVEMADDTYQVFKANVKGTLTNASGVNYHSGGVNTRTTESFSIFVETSTYAIKQYWRVVGYAKNKPISKYLYHYVVVADSAKTDEVTVDINNITNDLVNKLDKNMANCQVPYIVARWKSGWFTSAASSHYEFDISEHPIGSISPEDIQSQLIYRVKTAVNGRSVGTIVHSYNDYIGSTGAQDGGANLDFTDDGKIILHTSNVFELRGASPTNTYVSGAISNFEIQIILTGYSE